MIQKLQGTMAKLCLMTILVILLLQLFSLNRAFIAPDDTPIANTYTPAWRYRCVPDEGCERTTHPHPGLETSARNNSAMVFVSMDVCRTVCGRFGGLWPRPVTAAIGIQTVKIHPNYLRLQ